MLIIAWRGGLPEVRGRRGKYRRGTRSYKRNFWVRVELKFVFLENERKNGVSSRDTKAGENNARVVYSVHTGCVIIKLGVLVCYLKKLH